MPRVPYRVPDRGANLNVAVSRHLPLEVAVREVYVSAPVAVAPQEAPPLHRYSPDTTRRTFFWENFTRNNDAPNHQLQNFASGTRGGAPDAGRSILRQRFLAWASPSVGPEHIGFDPAGGIAGGNPGAEGPLGHGLVDMGNWFKRDVARLRPASYHEQLPEEGR